MSRSAFVLFLGLAVSACSSTPSSWTALSQSAPDAATDDGGVAWRVTPYIWAADLDGNATVDGNKVEFDLPFSDTLDHLDSGGQLQVEARSGRVSVIIDATYMDLSADGSVKPGPGPLPPQPVDLNASLLIGGAGVLVRLDDESPTELGAGVRYLEMDTEVKLAAQPTVRDDVYFVDAVVMARHVWPLGDDGIWHLNLYGDVGKGDSDLTWQSVATVNRAYDGWTLSLGYRYLDYDLGGSNDTDVTFRGVIAGASFFF